MLLAELELGRVLDRDDALVVRDEGRQHIEGGGLARAGPARDEEVELGLDAGSNEVEHFGGCRSEADEVLDRERLGRELADRDHRSDERERLDNRVDARTVGKPGIDPRARIVDPPAERRDDPIDDPKDVLVVQEDGVDALDLPARLDVDVRRAVDHDLGDGVVAEQRLQRTEARDVVDHLLD